MYSEIAGFGVNLFPQKAWYWLPRVRWGKAKYVEFKWFNIYLSVWV